MVVERVPELEVFVEHGVALVPAELLEAGGMDAPVHAGGERAAFERVAGEQVAVEAGGFGALLDDAGDSAGGDRLGADPRAGEGTWPGGQGPDTPEQRAFRDPGRLLPTLQRPHGTKFGR